MGSKDEFDSAGPFTSMKDLVGNLVLFTPLEHLKDQPTDFGTKDAIVADMVVLDAEGGPVEYDGAMIFQGKLIGALKRKIATQRKMLGVVAIGEAKKGQSAPYELHAPTDEQKELASRYLAGQKIDPVPAKEAAPQADPFAV